MTTFSEQSYLKSNSSEQLLHSLESEAFRRGSSFKDVETVVEDVIRSGTKDVVQHLTNMIEDHK